VFRKAAERGRQGLVPFDADRSAVEAARRDSRRFEPLYRKYVGQVYSFAAYELRDHHAAEDVTEQVFLQALRGLPDFEERGAGPASTFRVWLFQIARRVLANEHRRRARHPQASLDAALDVSAAGLDPAALAASSDEARRAWHAIGRLPTERRRVLTLRFVEEMSTPEIAGVMGRSEGAVRVLIHRALRAVAAELDRD
jgi:RNA polymerase sigma-70 factor (ECF subfamily)